MIDFKNLIVGSHESKVLFTWNVDHEGAMLGAFLGIEDGIESILARDETTRLPLSSALSLKSSAQSRERTTGTSRRSGSRFTIDRKSRGSAILRFNALHASVTYRSRVK